MNITFAQYNTDIDGSNSTVNATIDGIEMCVPISLANRHFAEIMRQVDAGELTIEEAD